MAQAGKRARKLLRQELERVWRQEPLINPLRMNRCAGYRDTPICSRKYKATLARARLIAGL